MAPQVKKFQDLTFVQEVYDNDTMKFETTEFGVIEPDDRFYFGSLPIEKLKITLPQYEAALKPIPDQDVYSKVPDGNRRFTHYSGDITSCLYLKRPRLDAYSGYKEQDFLEVMRGILLEEAGALERVAKLPPHPGLITYHDCRFQRGFMTGIVMDRHVSDLHDYYDHRMGPPVDKTAFMHVLVSAVRHLHSCGYAHNDINYRNVLVSAEGLPVLADFDSCKPIGEKLTFSRGTEGWNDVPLEEYKTSEVAHDLYGVKKIEEWLEGQNAKAMQGAKH